MVLIFSHFYFCYIVISYFCGICLASQVGITKESDSAWYAKKLASNETRTFTSSIVHVLRLAPNEDLLESLWKYARVKEINAASIVSTVGSLKQFNIRYANQEEGEMKKGHFEIVSLVGNIDFQDVDNPNYVPSGHVHISVADESGSGFGGHLLSGNLIYTTAEITLLEIKDGIFTRRIDDGADGSGYAELQVLNKL